MLVNVPRPEELVREMARLVRPGGVVALHEADSTTQRCDPPLTAYTRLLQLLGAYAEMHDIDRAIAVRVPPLLRESGVVDIRVNPLVHVYPPTHTRRMMPLKFVENTRTRLLAASLVDEAELDELTAALKTTWKILRRSSCRPSSSRSGAAGRIYRRAHPGDSMTRDGVFQVFGLNQSYFTRKVVGYLDHKRIGWTLRRAGGLPPDMVARGFPGGIPAVETPDGELMWDSTAMIGYLERRFPEPAVLPTDPALLFLCYLIDDVCDEWLYRPAVGSRWFIDENTRLGGYELGRDMSVQLPVTADQAHAMSGAFVRSSCGPLGVSAENIQSWVDEVLRPWMRVLGAHFESPSTAYLFGTRPSLADFAVFGGCAAHFANDPACRRWMDEDAPALVRHTHRILEPHDPKRGDWLRSGELPDTLVAVLADAGRLYLPWVSVATVRGQAELAFASGQRVVIHATEFLKDARSILLARYRALRNDALDAILERAGIRRFFADHVAEAGVVPTWDTPPRPRLNRPYPPENET